MGGQEGRKGSEGVFLSEFLLEATGVQCNFDSFRILDNTYFRMLPSSRGKNAQVFAHSFPSLIA